MSYQDRQLGCVDCSTTFTLTAHEQQFFSNKGFFPNDPRRCPACRAARKRERSGGIRHYRQTDSTMCVAYGAQTKGSLKSRVRSSVCG